MRPVVKLTRAARSDQPQPPGALSHRVESKRRPKASPLQFTVSAGEGGRDAGDLRPRAPGGDRRSSLDDVHRASRRSSACLQTAPTSPSAALRRSPAGHGLGFGTIRRFPVRHRMTAPHDDVKDVESATVDGARFVSRFDFRRRRRIAGFTDLVYDVSATTYVHGLGYSFVDIRERTIGMASRLWVLATPVDSTFIDLVLVAQVRELRKPKRPIAGLGFLPLNLRTRIMNKLLISAQERDVLQDVAIWGRKKYRPHPSLCRSDGAIGRYRRYCRQFYPHGGR